MSLAFKNNQLIPVQAISVNKLNVDTCMPHTYKYVHVCITWSEGMLLKIAPGRGDIGPYSFEGGCFFLPIQLQFALESGSLWSVVDPGPIILHFWNPYTSVLFTNMKLYLDAECVGMSQNRFKYHCHTTIATWLSKHWGHLLVFPSTQYVLYVFL